MAEALNYLHIKKPSPIIHRDISSGNVLLWRQGNRWRGKVSGYGAAKFKEQEMSIGPGCFAYSAPEVNKSLNQTGKVICYLPYYMTFMQPCPCSMVKLLSYKAVVSILFKVVKE